MSIHITFILEQIINMIIKNVLFIILFTSKR